MAQLKDTIIDGSLTVSNSNDIYLDTGRVIYAKNSEGINRSLVQTNANGEAFFGYGGYKNSEAASYVDGNVVNIRSKGGIYITDPDAGLNSRAYGQNKILWSGTYYMTSGHTATLSESISAQPNGIVLVFARYASGSNPYAWTTHFVPKHMVNVNNGSGHTFIMTTNSFGCPATKYLYITNTTIKGNDNNSATGTSNGVTYNNNAFALYYVIGV